VAPRFALSCSGENLRQAAEYARGNGLLLHTHASEQAAEVELVRERTGMENIAYLDAVGLSGPDVCLAHCVHTGPEERALLQASGTRVLHCPSANLKLGSGCAPVPEYLAAGIIVSLGADGAPCNNRLDMFTEMREAALMQKPRLGPAALPARDVVGMATLNGARTLGWEEEMGTLEEGKRANLILVNREALSATPPSDPATDLVYAHGASDVLLTMVNGEILFEDGRCTTIDEEALREEVRRERKRLVKRAGL
jgi:5-methylthioadenosine/S-adenosylhomocysteine deaminase